MRSKEFITAPQIVMTINKTELLKACHKAMEKNPLETERFVEICGVIYNLSLVLDNYDYCFASNDEEKLEEIKKRIPLYFMRIFTILYK